MSADIYYCFCDARCDWGGCNCPLGCGRPPASDVAPLPTLRERVHHPLQKHRADHLESWQTANGQPFVIGRDGGARVLDLPDEGQP